MFSWGEAGELGFVKFWQCSARCVFFMVRQARLGELGYVLYCGDVRSVVLRYGKFW